MAFSPGDRANYIFFAKIYSLRTSGLEDKEGGTENQGS